MNDANGTSRETVSNESGEYSFPALDPGTYSIRVAVPGFRTFERKGLRVNTQANPRPRHHARSRRPGRDDHGHGGFTADRDDQRLHRRRRRRQDTGVDSDGGSQRVPDGHARADGAVDRECALEPHAGSAGQLGPVDGRWRRAVEQLPGGRVPGDRPPEQGFDQSDDGSRRRDEGAGAHLRRRNGPHGRRRHEHDRPLRLQPWRGSGYTVSVRKLGAATAHPLAAGPAEHLREQWKNGGGGGGGPIIKNKTFFWIAGEAYTDNQPQQNRSWSRPTAETTRRLFPDDAQRRAQRDQGPAHGRAVPGQRDSGGPPEPGRPSRSRTTCQRRTRRWTTDRRTSA